jgi:D,D-heptose 1,7-bisphosphate phosphatase
MKVKNTRKKDLLILAGGRGSRIYKFTKKIPKPIIKFDNKTFLELLIRHINIFDFENIFILCGYKGKLIYKKFNNKIYNFTYIKCFIEKKQLGTWGAINSIKKKIKNDFLVINADSILNTNIKKIFKLKSKKILNMYLTKNSIYKSNRKLSSLVINKDNIEIKKNSRWMNAGIYFFSRKIFNENISNYKSIENDVIPYLIKKKKVGGFLSRSFFLDIGTYKNLEKAKNILINKLSRPAIIFDRDGVINFDRGYTYKIKDFIFRPNIIKTLKFLSNKKFFIFIVTNQAGIAKGHYSEKDFFLLHKIIKQNLEKKEIYIHDVKFCPYHPEAKIKKYRKNSGFRKPGNLMIKELFNQWPIIENKSFLIGDKLTDKIAAKKSKIYFEYISPNVYTQVKKIIKKLNINNY